MSFNDYYAQDISNKIKSVKNRKIEKGEFQGGIAPYGYKKDPKIKNHLIIDKYAGNIVKEIFDMYVNKGMSTIKIADELNKREIESPATYLKIPKFTNKLGDKKNGKYIWLRTQIGKILKNEVYIGNIVGRKYEKISHKIAKVRATSKDEQVIVKNMHEPIITMDIWNKAQELINKKHKIRNRKYDHPLKGLIFCKECGSIATLRCRTEERKDGRIWRADYFICSNRNNYTGLCECKQIPAKKIEDNIIMNIEQEIAKITYTQQDLKEMLNKVITKIQSKENSVISEKDNLQRKLSKIDNELQEIYEDKLNKIITAEDFLILHEAREIEKRKILNLLDDTKLKVEEIQKRIKNIDIKTIEKETCTFLKLEKLDKIVYEKLVDKIEFDKEKNIKIKFKFKAG